MTGPDLDDTPEVRVSPPRDVLFGAAPTRTAPAERHWFVPDETGIYCLACALPERNRRHAPRKAA